MIDNLAQLMYGENARHVPAWFYLRTHGEGVVSFAGASRVESNPLLYGSERDLRFGVGEIIVRPHMLVGTDALLGHTMGQVLTETHDVERYLASGEYIVRPGV